MPSRLSHSMPRWVANTSSRVASARTNSPVATHRRERMSSLLARTIRLTGATPDRLRGRDGLARLQDVLDPHRDVRLGVALEPAVVLPPPEVLDHRLRRRVPDHLPDHPGPGHQRL